MRWILDDRFRGRLPIVIRVEVQGLRHPRRRTFFLLGGKNTLLSVGRLLELVLLPDAARAVPVEPLRVVQPLIVWDVPWREVKTLNRLSLRSVESRLRLLVH